jgi:predicted nuclease of predicted toxin-antitoxin system
MRLLFDENISWRIVKKITHLYPDSESSVRLHLIGHEDDIVWKKAKRESYTIVTFDDDYLNLSQLNGFPPKVIFIRPGNLSTQQIADLLIRNHSVIQIFLTDPEEERGCLELFDFAHF